MIRRHVRPAAAAIVALIALASCGTDEAGDDDGDTETTNETTIETTIETLDETLDDAPAEDETTNAMTQGLDPAAFFDGALVGDAITTDCTLSNGAAISCLELTVAGFPANRDSIGPWCPATTSDDAAGIWFDGDAVYDIDGEFIVDLAEIYDDPTWRLYDEDGNVLSTDTSEAFNDLVTGGAQPDPDAGPVNLCVYGEIEWTEEVGPTPATVEIPVEPVMADAPSAVSTIVGVTLDGVRIEGSAPIDLILGNYTIGAFDPCGGHVNPQEGYHMHASTGCSDATVDLPEGETAQFGYALDGFAIHAPYDHDDTAVELDECNGHETVELGYHYHANLVEENAVLTCFSGLVVDGGAGGADGPPGGGGGAPPADG